MNNEIICAGYLRALAQDAEDQAFRNCYMPYLKLILAAASRGDYNCEIWCSSYEFCKEMELRGFYVEIDDTIHKGLQPLHNFSKKDFVTSMKVKVSWNNAGSF